MLFMEIISVLCITEPNNNTVGVTQSSCVSNLVLQYMSEVQSFYAHSVMHAADLFGQCEFL